MLFTIHIREIQNFPFSGAIASMFVCLFEKKNAYCLITRYNELAHVGLAYELADQTFTSLVFISQSDDFDITLIH